MFRATPEFLFAHLEYAGAHSATYCTCYVVGVLLLIVGDIWAMGLNQRSLWPELVKLSESLFSSGCKIFLLQQVRAPLIRC
jgi:triphosphoribosyl-dephospho-CoA synthetase